MECNFRSKIGSFLPVLGFCAKETVSSVAFGVFRRCAQDLASIELQHKEREQNYPPQIIALLANMVPIPFCLSFIVWIDRLTSFHVLEEIHAAYNE